MYKPYHDIPEEDKEFWKRVSNECVKHGQLVDSSDGQFTGNFWHETWQCFGHIFIFYYEDTDLIGVDGA